MRLIIQCVLYMRKKFKLSPSYHSERPVVQKIQQSGCNTCTFPKPVRYLKSVDSELWPLQRPAHWPTYLHTGVSPVVVWAVLSWDAPRWSTLTLVPEAHPPLLGLLKDLDVGLGHCRAEKTVVSVERGTFILELGFIHLKTTLRHGHLPDIVNPNPKE